MWSRPLVTRGNHTPTSGICLYPDGCYTFLNGCILLPWLSWQMRWWHRRRNFCFLDWHPPSPTWELLFYFVLFLLFLKNLLFTRNVKTAAPLHHPTLFFTTIILSNIFCETFHTHIKIVWIHAHSECPLHPSPGFHIIMSPTHPTILQKSLTLVVSPIILKRISVLQLHFLYNLLALLLHFPCTSFHLSHCVLIICSATIPLKTAFASLYIGTLPSPYTRRK